MGFTVVFAFALLTVGAIDEVITWWSTGELQEICIVIWLVAACGCAVYFL